LDTYIYNAQVVVQGDWVSSEVVILFLMIIDSIIDNLIKAINIGYGNVV
jgi:hypothetical protein